MFKNKYRVIADNYNGYEAQKKRWWFPLWLQMGRGGFTNTFSSLSQAKDFIEEDGKVYVVYISDT